MKRTFLILLVSTLLFACGNEKKQETDSQSETELSAEEELPVLLGKQEITAIKSAPYSSWFMENYKYSPNQKVLGSLKEALEGKKMTIFMGTWCEDSQRQVPALLNVLDAIKYDTSTINLITVSEEKDTPEGLEEGFDIQFVPTIILYDGDQELGRIVEYPIQTLEEDLLKIAKGEEYNHAYSDIDIE